jgi:hypothetical protein
MGITSFDQIYSKYPAERLHLKFCKSILGVHSKTTNIAVLSELDRFPLSFNIIKAMQKFYYRLENSETTFPLLYNAFLESKVLHNLRKPSWYTAVHSLIENIKSFLTQKDRSKKIKY